MTAPELTRIFSANCQHKEGKSTQKKPQKRPKRTQTNAKAPPNLPLEQRTPPNPVSKLSGFTCSQSTRITLLRSQHRWRDAGATPPGFEVTSAPAALPGRGGGGRCSAAHLHRASRRGTARGDLALPRPPERGGAGRGRRLRNPRLPLARAGGKEGGVAGGIRARGGPAPRRKEEGEAPQPLDPPRASIAGRPGGRPGGDPRTRRAAGAH